MENSVYPDQYGQRGYRHGLSIRRPRRCQKGLWSRTHMRTRVLRMHTRDFNDAHIIFESSRGVGREKQGGGGGSVRGKEDIGQAALVNCCCSTTASCRNESGMSGGARRKGLPVCAAPLRVVFPGCSLDRCCSVLSSLSTGSCTKRNAQAAASTGVVTHQPDELAQSVFKSCNIFLGILLRGACSKSQAYNRCAFISSGQEMKLT
jgi:hypothetical protein